MKVLSWIRKIEMFVAAVFLTVIIIMVFWAALVRYFGHPVAWSIDVAQLLFGWVVFLGADIALKNNSHIGIDMVVKLFPKKLQTAVIIANSIVACVFLGVIAYFGFDLCIQNYQRLYNTLPISYSYATASVPVGSVLMLITLIGKIIGLVRKKGPADMSANNTVY